MTVLIGAGLILAGAAVAVLQVRLAAASSGPPPRRWHVSESLPRGQRYGSDIAIAVLLCAGAFVVAHGRRGWVFYVAIVGAALVTAAAQALALRALPERAEH
ncbi:hypothetical protein ACI8AG_12130 [Blastococcus sp. SYSU DS0552]